MRTIVALLAAFPLLAAAQSTTTAPPASPADEWEQIPPPQPAAPTSETAPPEAAPQAAPAPAPAAPPPPQAAPPAQPPPPQAAPPAPPPPYSPPAARPPRSRDDWYIGFGLGGGDGLIKTDAGTFTFKEANGGRSTATLFLNFKVGGTLSPKLLLGLDVSVVDASSDEGGVTSSLSVSNVDAMLTWFPWERGLFLRGGGGLSAATASYEDPTVSVDGDSSGFNVTGGVGYALWLGKQFNLTLNLDYSRQWFDPSEKLAWTDAQYWSLWMGFDWY